MSYNPAPKTFTLVIRNWGRYMMTGRYNIFTITADIAPEFGSPRLTVRNYDSRDPFFMLTGDDSGSGYAIGKAFMSYETLDQAEQPEAYEAVAQYFSSIVHAICDPELPAPFHFEVNLK